MANKKKSRGRLRFPAISQS